MIVAPDARESAKVAEHPVLVREGPACFRDSRVPADMVPVRAGIGNEKDWLARDCPNRCQHLAAHLRVACVHYEQIFITHLHGDVPARTDEHIDPASHRQYVDFRAVIRISVERRSEIAGWGSLLRGKKARGTHQQDEQAQCP